MSEIKVRSVSYYSKYPTTTRLSPIDFMDSFTSILSIFSGGGQGGGSKRDTCTVVNLYTHLIGDASTYQCEPMWLPVSSDLHAVGFLAAQMGRTNLAEQMFCAAVSANALLGAQDVHTSLLSAANEARQRADTRAKAQMFQGQTHRIPFGGGCGGGGLSLIHI